MMDSKIEADSLGVGTDLVSQVANDGEELACRSPDHECPRVQWAAFTSSLHPIARVFCAAPCPVIVLR
jgi:hypothetical protein